MLEVEAAVTRHQRLGGAPLGISRASWLRDLAWDIAPIRLPVVGGQTVWTATSTPVIPVVEQPNWFGRIEKDPPQHPDAMAVVWWAGAPQPGYSNVVEVDRPVGSTATAQNLARRLRQVAGIKLPHDQPETPWFVVSLPGDASAAAADLRSGGFTGCEPTGPSLAEFPGGLRIEVAWPATENDRFAKLLKSSLDR